MHYKLSTACKFLNELVKKIVTPSPYGDSAEKAKYCNGLNNGPELETQANEEDVFIQGRLLTAWRKKYCYFANKRLQILTRNWDSLCQKIG